jgi:hypothetical protein
MKCKAQLLLLSVLMFGAQGAAMSESTSPFPADAEASNGLPAPETYADRHGGSAAGESAATWGVSQRDRVDPFMEASGLMGKGPFPSSGGPIDGGD